MAFTGPIEDRLAIRELIETYADAVMQVDQAAWAALWIEDSRWCLPDYPGMDDIVGKDAIVSMWATSMKDYPGLIYIATPGAIQVDGDRATGRVYTSELYNRPDGKVERMRGQYDDEYVKRDGRWYFRQRSYRSLHVAQS